MIARIAAATAVALLAGLLPAQAETLRFDVLRNDSQIGTHVIAIDQKGDSTKVDIATNVAVKIAFVTAYRFTHEGHETWQAQALTALTSQTNDDGKKHQLAVRGEADRLAVHADGHDTTAEAMGLGSLWNARFLAQGRLLNTLDGSVMAVDIRDAGPETLQGPRGPLAAHHFVIRGDLVRDVWYDEKGLLARLTMAGSDGSPVEYRRQ